MLIANNLTKIYGRFIAAENVSFKVEKGEIACFLGPNGAGKSTTMKMLVGFLAPTSGSASIAGYDMARERINGSRSLGYLPENGPLYPDMTPESLLTFFAELRRIPSKTRRSRINEVVELCELQSVFRRPLGRLSRGYRQRVGLAQAMIHDPEVLILDEPTTGLDPNQLEFIRSVIRQAGRDKALLLSTHIMQEVEAMCSRAVIINHGRIVADDPVSNQTAAQLTEKFHQLTEN